MRRWLRFFLLGALMLAFLCVRAEAASEDALSQMEEIMPNGITEDNLSERLGVEGTMTWLIELFSSQMPEAVRFFLLMLSVGVLSSLSNLLGESYGMLSRSVHAAVQTILSVCVWGWLFVLVGDVIATIEDVCALCTAALPIFVGVHVAYGAGESALSTAAGLGGLLSVLEWMLTIVFVPLFSLYFGTAMLGAIETEGPVRRLSERVYRLFLSWMALFSLVVSGVMSLQSALASAKDTLLLRTVRHATGTMIPLVGSTVSGTLSALLTGGAYVRQTAGTMALVALLSVSLPLLCRLLLCRLCLGGLSLLPSELGAGGSVYHTVCHTLDLLLALLAMAVSLFLLAVVLFLHSGGEVMV